MTRTQPTSPASPAAEQPADQPGRRAYLGLGSNLGDRRELLRQAVRLLQADQGVDITAVSPVYETDPIGGPEQGAYLNIVAAVQTTLDPQVLLKLCLDIEQRAGRIRRERWGPRTLDIDLLWVENITLNEPNLTLPHPRMRQRRFVMIPLADVAPEFLHNWIDPQDGEVTATGALFDPDWPTAKAELERNEPEPPPDQQPGTAAPA